eukprot:jgi/Mesvir1/9051/Mv21329-RA.2
MASHCIAPCTATWLSGARSTALSASHRQLPLSRRGIRKKYQVLNAQASWTSRKEAEVRSGKGLRDLNCDAVLASNSNEDSTPYSDLRGANEARTTAGVGGVSRRQLIIPTVLAAVFLPCSPGWAGGENVPLGAREVREILGVTPRNELKITASGDVRSEYTRRLKAPGERDKSDYEEMDFFQPDEGPSPSLIDETRDEDTQQPLPAVESSIPEPPAFQELKVFAKDLAFGAVAGGVGAAAVYPVDFVKTRMQAQREPLHSEGEAVEAPKYRNGWDCIATVVREDGVLALYDGLLPQMLGVAPEKAIKISINNFLRRELVNLANVPSDSALPVHLAFLAGGLSGLAQIVVANPTTMVKVQLQMQGRIIQIAKERLRVAMAAADAAAAAAASMEGPAGSRAPAEGSAQLVLVKETSSPVAPVVLPTVPKRQTAMDVRAGTTALAGCRVAPVYGSMAAQSSTHPPSQSLMAAPTHSFKPFDKLLLSLPPVLSACHVLSHTWCTQSSACVHPIVPRSSPGLNLKPTAPLP